MPFTQKTIDFLFENRLHDSREWFGEHKADYAEYVIKPLSELIEAVTPAMHKIDPEIICDPKKISRIYRDARYAHDSVFRDMVWYTFARKREDAYEGHPGYYFAIGVGGISYGCGYYNASADVKKAACSLVLADDPSYIAAREAYEGQRTFAMYGELYKKNRFPDAPPEKLPWLNRKALGVDFSTNDPKVMFSEGLAKKAARDFLKIAPLYDFYMKAGQLAIMDKNIHK